MIPPRDMRSFQGTNKRRNVAGILISPIKMGNRCVLRVLDHSQRARNLRSRLVNAQMEFEGDGRVLRLDRKALESLQIERLRWSVQHAYEQNPCYRRKFDAIGVRPEDLIRSLADLARFPFTGKADLRAAYPFLRRQRPLGLSGGRRDAAGEPLA
jgi:hypothetical protein